MATKGMEIKGDTKKVMVPKRSFLFFFCCFMDDTQILQAI